MKDRISNVLFGRLVISDGTKSSAHWLSGSRKRWLGLLIKLAISAAAVTYIISQLQIESQTLLTLGVALSSIPVEMALLTLWISVFLVAINWGIEMLKWYILIKPGLNVPWTSAVKGVLTGTTIGVFTPNRFGEFIGRVLALHPSQRLSAVLLSLYNGIAQNVATLTFGILGLLFLIQSGGTQAFGGIGSVILQITLILMWMITMFLYHLLPKLSQLTFRKRIWRHWRRKYFRYGKINQAQLYKIYWLSMLRFMAFIAQYLIVFMLIAPDSDVFQIIMLSALTMFSSTILAAVPVPDLIVRETVAIGYFTLFSFDAVEVAAVVFFVWMWNVAFPALIGSAVLFTYRIFRTG